MTLQESRESSTFGVLLVDDTPDIRFLLRFAIEGNTSGKVIAEASNGAEAIDLAAKLLPDVIVLDEMMPVMSGLEAAQSLRSVAPLARIILFSATAFTRSPQAAGLVDCVVNKVDGVDFLIGEITRQLQRSDVTADRRARGQ